jgi:hypothetical protein
VWLESASVAVWVCPSDPYLGSTWPHASNANTSGLVIETDSPDEGNFLLMDGEVHTLASKGGSGSWVIRAVAGSEGDADTDTDSDTDTDADTDTTTVPIELYAISPATTAEGVAVELVILGEGLQAGASAFIGGLSVTGGTVQDEGTFSGRSPTALLAGTHDVEVRNPDGTSDYLAAAFTVEGEPKDEGCGSGGARGGLLAWGALAGLVWLRGIAGMPRRAGPAPRD